jgi:hypothetical protein
MTNVNSRGGATTPPVAESAYIGYTVAVRAEHPRVPDGQWIFDSDYFGLRDTAREALDDIAEAVAEGAHASDQLHLVGLVALPTPTS